MLQPPTISGLRVRTPAEANILFHAVSTGLLPMVTRRLDNEERRAITSGSVFIWEERGPHAELTGVSGTDGANSDGLLMAADLAGY